MLEKTYKNIVLFTTKFINTLVSILKVLVISKCKTILPHPNQQSCIVLGNGPSLNESFQKHPDFFQKHSLVCVNGFSITKEFTDLKPSYYVMLDPGFWGNNREDVKQIIAAIITKTTWRLTILMPHQAKKSILIQQIELLNANITISYFNYTVFKGFTTIAHLLYKRNLAMPQSHNVLVASLFLCINMHFKNIYLFGADHTWHQNLYINEMSQLCIKDIHFYENEEKINYRLFYKHQKTIFKMHEIFSVWSKVFYGYELIRKYANSCDTKIYNASNITFIDAFERIDLKTFK